ncbi:MAG: MFS transporter [Gaiella sp.]
MTRTDELRPLLALVAVHGAADGALLPLLPSLRDQLGLTGLELAALLAMPTVVMLATAVPVGLLASRLGSGRLLMAVGLLLPLSLVGMALAPGLAVLLAARALFGLSFSVLWIVGPTRAAAGGRGTAGTGRLLGFSGVGWLGGPLAAGLAADVAGWRVALGLVALAAVPVLPGLVRARKQGGASATARLLPALRAFREERPVRLLVATSAVLGVVTGVSGLLPALVLARNGLSAGAIGVAMSLAAAVWIVAARATGRAGAIDNARPVGLCLAALAVAWLLPAASLSSLAVVGFLIVSAACRSSLGTLIYALGARAAGEGAAAAVVGMMNLGWAVAALIAPFAAGSAESDTGVRTVFALTAAIAGAVAWRALRAEQGHATLTA